MLRDYTTLIQVIFGNVRKENEERERAEEGMTPHT